MATDEKNGGGQGSTGPIDIPRQPGEDQPPSADEVPGESEAKRNEKTRASRSGRHDVNADRRRSHAPYSGTERRAR